MLLNNNLAKNLFKSFLTSLWLKPVKGYNNFIFKMKNKNVIKQQMKKKSQKAEK